MTDALTLEEAARLVGVSSRALRARAQRGTLPTSTVIRDGRAVQVVSREALEDAYKLAPEKPPAPASEEPAERSEPHTGTYTAEVRSERTAERSEPPPMDRERVPARSVRVILELREEREELRQQVARLEGQLSMSERVEVAAQRYADKLEAQLSEARQREASMARALGSAEGRAEQAERRLAELAAPAEELEPPRRREWRVWRR